MDEAGTLLCVTVDFEVREDNSVTIRDRNTTKQIRVKLDDLNTELAKVILCNDYSSFN